MENEVVNVFIVAGAVIKEDGKYLLVQEMLPSAYGLWNFPAGKVDVGETIEQAAVREAMEEVGFRIELIRKIDIFQDNANDPVKHAFEARIISGELNFPKDEMLDARWFSFEEIKNMKEKLRSSWILGAIEIMEEAR